MNTPLSEPGLPSSAKIIWIVLRRNAHAGPLGPGAIEARSGLTRHTVLRGIARLTASGWCVVRPGNCTFAVVRTAGGHPSQPALGPTGLDIPPELLADRRVGSRAKLLYGILQTTPHFRHRSGRFTCAALSRSTGASLNAVKRAVRDLVQGRWLRTTQKHLHAPVAFTLRNPMAIRGEIEVARARKRLQSKKTPRGEALMREFLTLLVRCDRFQDNATPGFLRNPWTRELLQLDRYYEGRAGFEFNGPQHYGPTERYPDEEEYQKQRARDWIKRGRCQDQGIECVVVHAEDLSLEGMRRKVGKLLPLRDLREHQALIRYLEEESAQYREAAQSGRGQGRPPT